MVKHSFLKSHRGSQTIVIITTSHLRPQMSSTTSVPTLALPPRFQLNAYGNYPGLNKKELRFKDIPPICSLHSYYIPGITYLTS